MDIFLSCSSSDDSLILSSHTGLPKKVYCVPCTAQNLVNQDFFFQDGGIFLFFILKERLHLSIFSSSEPSLHLDDGEVWPQRPMEHACDFMCSSSHPQLPTLTSLKNVSYSYPVSFSFPRSSFVLVDL